MADKDILQFAKNSKNILDADDDEKGMNNAVPVPTPSMKTRAMADQLKALLEGINALKNGQEETRQEVQKGPLKNVKTSPFNERAQHEG
ncbi:hypothetical protein TNCV_3494111 [Trichonephila clavipes]|nr:hypothetical protein TNCV_3494111 [Trichonephila clavipes]